MVGAIGQPGKVKFGGVVGDGFIRVGHLLDDVVNDRFCDQDDSPAFNRPSNPPQVPRLTSRSGWNWSMTYCVVAAAEILPQPPWK